MLFLLAFISFFQSLMPHKEYDEASISSEHPFSVIFPKDAYYYSIANSNLIIIKIIQVTMEEGYQCHICWETAVRPVVTPCGHLFCWPCIYQWLRSNQQYLTCPTCKSGLEIMMLRSILIPGQPPQRTENGIPPRPKPIRKFKNQIHRQKQNVDEFGELPRAIRNISMNMYRGVLLGGYGLFPSCYSMLFHQKHKKVLPNESVMGGSKQYKFWIMLEFWSFVVGVIALILFIYL